MNDDETNLYGWKMRLLQVEEDIYYLEKQRKLCSNMVEGAKLGMCFNNALLLTKDYIEYDKLGKQREDFKQLVLDLYLLATECEDKIKAYEPQKEEFKFKAEK